MTAGGYRPGSGRKLAEPGEKKVQVVITVTPETKKKLKAVSEAKGLTPGKLIDQIMNTLY